MAFQVGEQVGPYRITDKLGQGGMATVYRGYHANLDRYVAIKVLHTAFKEDPNFLERFKREAQIVAKLEHPNIIPIYDFADHQGQPYLVMKLIQGETLKAHLKRGPLTLDQAVRMLDAVAQALTYAHDRGILHRDIKPSNIMLDLDDIPYIADFGLARIVQAGESTLSQDIMLGTPQYISPEQAKGEYSLGPSTDIYSMGVVLYEIVVGQVPFNGDTPYAIVHDHIYKALPLPTKVNPQVPVEVENVLLRALAKDPADRYASAVDMIIAFRQAVKDAGMTELSAIYTRPQVAEISTSAITGPQVPTISPPPGSTPVFATPGSTPVFSTIQPPVTQSTPQYILAQKEAYRRRANLWILSGVGLLLLTCLASLFIIARAVSDPDSRPWKISDNTDISDDEHSKHDETQQPYFAVPEEITLEEAQAALEAAPDDPMTQIQVGMAMLREGNTDEALDYILGALDALEIPPAALNAFATTLIEKDRQDIAFVLYLELLSRVNTPTDITDGASYFLYTYTLAEPASARVLSAQYIAYRANSAAAEIINALALLETDRPLLIRQAGTTLDALTLEQDLAEFYLVRGLYYLKIDETDNALSDWRYALDIDDAPQWLIEVVTEFIDQYSSTVS